eukprot:11222233-Lingulodinium_polyedra.AAC.1
MWPPTCEELARPEAPEPGRGPAAQPDPHALQELVPALREGPGQGDGPQAEEGGGRVQRAGIPHGLLLPGRRGRPEVDDPGGDREALKDEEGFRSAVEGVDGQARGEDGDGPHRRVRGQRHADHREVRPGAGDQLPGGRHLHGKDGGANDC